MRRPSLLLLPWLLSLPLCNIASTRRVAEDAQVAAVLRLKQLDWT